MELFYRELFILYGFLIVIKIIIKTQQLFPGPVATEKHPAAGIDLQSAERPVTQWGWGRGGLRGTEAGLTPQSHKSITLELAPDGRLSRGEMGQSPADRNGSAPGMALARVSSGLGAASPGGKMGRPCPGLGGKVWLHPNPIPCF